MAGRHSTVSMGAGNVRKMQRGILPCKETFRAGAFTQAQLIEKQDFQGAVCLRGTHSK